MAYRGAGLQIVPGPSLLVPLITSDLVILDSVRILKHGYRRITNLTGHLHAPYPIGLGQKGMMNDHQACGL